MNKLIENFDLEAAFSPENPLLQSLTRTHKLIAKTIDQTARIQLAFAEELLDMNKRRFESLYAGDSIKDTISAHRDLLSEAGNRTFKATDDLRKVATELQTGIVDASNDFISVATTTVTDAVKPGKTAKASKKAA